MADRSLDALDAANAADIEEPPGYENGHDETAEGASIDRDDTFEADQTLVEPQVHELEAFLLWDQHGLEPYWALADAFADWPESSFDFGGHRWEFWAEADGDDRDEAGCRSWTGNLAQPDAPDEALEEYQLVVVQDDDLHQRRATVQIRPKVPDAVNVSTGEPIQQPDDTPAGVSVQLANSENLDSEEIEPLLRAAVQALGLEEEHFPEGETHEWSRGLAMGQYLRITRAESEAHIVPRDGILERMAMFSSTREGKGQYMWDNREIVGHRNVVVLNEQACDKLLPGRDSVAKRLKSYHTAQPTAEETEDPTTSPKLEIQWEKELSSTTAVPWDADDAFDFGDLEAELDEFLMNAVSWSGLSTRPTEQVYVADEYWELPGSERDLELRPNPLPELQEAEEDLVLQHTDPTEARPSEWEVFEALSYVGDGSHWSVIAEEAGVSKTSIYRAAEAFDPLIEVVDGVVRFADNVIRQKAESVIDRVTSAAERAVESLSNLTLDARSIDPESALGKWARTYAKEIADDLDGLTIELVGEYDYGQILKVLRSGFQAARATGRHSSDKFLEATFVWHDPREGRVERRAFVQDHGTVRLLGAPMAPDT